MHFSTSLAALFFVYLNLVNAFESDLFALSTTGTSGFVFTEFLLFSSDQGSAGTCALKCFRTASCLSFTFTGVKEPGNCRGHNQIMALNHAKTNKAGARSFAFPLKKVWEDKNCTSAADCGPITNVICVHGLCVCHTSYPIYSESLNQCISDCPDSALTSNFMLYPNSVISGYNSQVIGGMTEDGCKNTCLQSTSFTCQNVEQYLNGNCYLQRVTA
ncbi:hypothetical protein V1264_018522 [Littorina saxatilis]|uniref:Apple domain-containing protein n=1 Tax=Littorina saxatilis TaxID=31220 RepID=A0AAN9BCT8_9CAEN